MNALLKSISDALVAFGPVGVLLLGLADSAGVPLPAVMDALLILVAVQSPQRAYLTALMAVLGSTAGNVGLFLAVRHGVRRFIPDEPPPGKRQRFQQWFRRYGLLTVFVPMVTPVPPLPTKPFVISAGALHTPLSSFLTVILVARFIRYFGLAYLGIQLGEDARAFLTRNAWTLVGIVLAMALVLYALMRVSDRGRQSVI